MPRPAATQSSLPLFDPQEDWGTMTPAQIARWIANDPALNLSRSDWHEPVEGSGDPPCSLWHWRSQNRRRVTLIRDMDERHLHHAFRMASTRRAHVSRFGALWAELRRRGFIPPIYTDPAQDTLPAQRGDMTPQWGAVPALGPVELEDHERSDAPDQPAIVPPRAQRARVVRNRSGAVAEVQMPLGGPAFAISEEHRTPLRNLLTGERLTPINSRSLFQPSLTDCRDLAMGVLEQTDLPLGIQFGVTVDEARMWINIRLNSHPEFGPVFHLCNRDAFIGLHALENRGMADAANFLTTHIASMISGLRENTFGPGDPFTDEDRPRLGRGERYWVAFAPRERAWKCWATCHDGAWDGEAIGTCFYPAGPPVRRASIRETLTRLRAQHPDYVQPPEADF